MTTQAPWQQVRTLHLGDIVRLPDGREMTLRAMELQLARTVGSMSGWMLAGEIGPSATLLSLPAGPHDPVTLFTPLEDIPSHARSARTECEGVVSYYAPHLPNVSGAMGELAYKVCSLRAAVEPMVLVWRGRELVVFVKSAISTLEALQFYRIPRDAAATEQDVDRHAGVVLSPNQARPGTPHEEAAPGRIRFLPGRRR